MPRPTAVVAITASVLLALTACSVGGTTGGGPTDKRVVVATHDAWAMSKRVLEQFTRRTGYHVVIEENGDAGALTNKLVLTKGDPIADLTYGIDNTFGSRAVDAGILADFTPADVPASAARFDLPGGSKQLTPIDYSDVCVNIDDMWFADHHLAPPKTLADLTRPAYRDLFVTEGATTSSTGLAFLLATIARYGAHWPDYWRALMANGAKVTAGWTDAWGVDYTAGGGNGDRPIVTSYASSPPDTIPKGGTAPTTSALLDTCFRQVEYAGVLKGAQNPAGARAFESFMLRRAFQSRLPEEMYVYPVDTSLALPKVWARYAATAPHPLTLPPATIAAKRDQWLRTWSAVTG
ncbi:MAG: thiamine ABC transporter substrate-binding protein [Nocardioidaceae bacterium]